MGLCQVVLVVVPDGMAMAAQDADRWGRRRPNSAGVMPATLSPLPDRASLRWATATTTRTTRSQEQASTA
jgi:hypothetical protein